MGNKLKNMQAQLDRRQKEFDAQRDKQGFKRPGSMNPHKQASGGAVNSCKKGYRR